MRTRGWIFFLLAALLCHPPYLLGAGVQAPRDIPYPGVIELRVDITDLERRLLDVREIIPARSGPLTLLYPRWLPGNHAPTGPIGAFSGLTITAAGKRVDWARDPVDVYAFHLVVPAGATSLDVRFQFASPQLPEQGRIVVTPEMVGLQWNTVVLYPAGHYASRITVRPALILPPAWTLASALDIESQRGVEAQFAAVSLEKLVDSPVFAGKHYARFDLDPGAAAPVHLNVFADSAASLEVTPLQLAAHRKLVQEMYEIFGAARHYDRYEFLLALSDHFGEIGLEHHQSSENRRDPGYFTEWERTRFGRTLLPHEFAHSWNGKFRRPLNLTTPDYSVPMQDTLLWVYEGLTDYWETVFAARSTLWSADLARQAWAAIAAELDRGRAGRTWRNLQDTTHQPIISGRKPLSWLSWQRMDDYYIEGQLLWLDVDTRLRELSGEQRSLDDFARAFFGVADGKRGPMTYTFEDIVAALDRVAADDWRAFLTQRLQSHGPAAPLDGLARGGWKLVYTDQPSDYVRAREEHTETIDLSCSLGITVSLKQNEPGWIKDVRLGSPAYTAGLAVGTTLIAVNGREYSPASLTQAITAAKSDRAPLELLVKKLDRYRSVRIAYDGGLQYPHLVRDEASPDRISAILKPRT